MGYIKFNIIRRSDEDGNTVYSRISRIESDLPQTTTLETNLIWHALSKSGGKVELTLPFRLNESMLNDEMYYLG